MLIFIHHYNKIKPSPYNKQTIKNMSLYENVVIFKVFVIRTYCDIWATVLNPIQKREATWWPANILLARSQLQQVVQIGETCARIRKTKGAQRLFLSIRVGVAG